jgi:TRAP-type C4-dicarboxylate transport system permease small subunit
MDRFFSVIEKINHVGNIIGSIFLNIVMLVIVCNIIVRLFGSVIQGSNEIVELMQGVAVSAAIVYTTLRRKHTVVDFVLEQMKPRLQAVLNAFTSFLSLIIWTLLAWTGGRYALEMWTRREMSETLELPYLPFRCVWVLASIILCVILFLNLVDFIKRAANK